MKLFFIIAFLMIFSFQSKAQTATTWKGKQCAVVLTYDDGLNVDLDNVIPELDSLGLFGTFYISDYFNGLGSQLLKWKSAAKKGHELANHSIWHPCAGGKSREFVTSDYNLNNYTLKRMINEVREMNTILKAIDGKSKRTFAYPCGDTKIHDTSYIDFLKTDFIAARGVKPEMLTIDKVDLSNIGCFMINGQTGEQMIELVKKAKETHSLLVFLFHGVGGEHALNVSINDHKQLLAYLKKNEKDLWVAPMLDVAEYIKNYQSKN